MKKGDEVQVSFVGRVMRRPISEAEGNEGWESVQIRIGGDVFRHGTFVAVVPAHLCRVLGGDED